MHCQRKHNNTFRFCPAVQQRGAALVVALLIFAVAAALMVGLQRDFTLHVQRTANAFLQEQAWQYLLGAEDLAAIALRLDTEQDAAREQPRDDLTEIWAQETTPYALDEGGWLAGQLEDLQGRFNLNNLLVSDAGTAGGGPNGVAVATTGPRFSPAQRQFIRLLQVLEAAEASKSLLSRQEAIALTEAICDFMDSDNEPRPQGAEAESYRSLTPAYYPANRPLASISELHAVKGMTEPVFRALAPLVTVWPAAGSNLNVLTATLPLMRTLVAGDSLEPLSQSDGELLLQGRGQGDWDSIEALLSLSIFTGQDTTGVESLITLHSDWFLLGAQVNIADRELRLYSVLERRQRKISTQYRSLGAL